ncbi:MAG: nucleotide-binding protein [Acetobacterium sp.]|nr:nucleotide-binding protein [Acetobacterium sp.]
MNNSEKLTALLQQFQSSGVAGYKKYEVTMVSIFKNIFGEQNDFTNRAKAIKSGWEVDGAILAVNGLISDTEYENNKYSAYISTLEEAIEFLDKYDDQSIGRSEIQLNNKKVFIVHGHDCKLKFELSDWLHRIGLIPIVLHLQPNIGIISIIEKIEHNTDVGCAIILMTADDLGKGKNEAELRPRARQNVVFEAGYFIGKLGRSRVIMLFDEGLEAPGDLGGCVYITADCYGGWKEAVRTEFSEIGIEYHR